MTLSLNIRKLPEPVKSGAKGGVWSFSEQDHGTINYNDPIKVGSVLEHTETM